MPYAIVFALSAYCVLSCSPTAATYELEAQTWVAKYCNARVQSPEDIHQAASLFYVSYLRSQATLLVQEAAFTCMDMLWHAWNTCAQARLNPSKQGPMIVSPQALEQSMQKFASAYAQQYVINTAYAYGIDICLNKCSINDVHLQAGIHALRNDSRILIAQDLLSIKNNLELLFESLSAQTRCFSEKIEAGNSATRSYNLADYIWSSIALFAVQSIIDIDAGHTQLSADSWQLYALLQQIGNHAWHSIEHTRAELYKAHYAAVYNYLESICATHLPLPSWLHTQSLLTEDCLPNPNTLL